MRLFKGGLRNAPTGESRLEFNKHSNGHDEHDNLNYSRGTISRSRSTFNQFLDYHQFYGGIRTSFGQR